MVIVKIIVILFLLYGLFRFWKSALEEHESLMKLNKAKEEFYETMKEYYKSDLVR